MSSSIFGLRSPVRRSADSQRDDHMDSLHAAFHEMSPENPEMRREAGARQLLKITSDVVSQEDRDAFMSIVQAMSSKVPPDKRYLGSEILQKATESPRPRLAELSNNIRATMDLGVSVFPVALQEAVRDVLVPKSQIASRVDDNLDQSRMEEAAHVDLVPLIIPIPKPYNEEVQDYREAARVKAIKASHSSDDIKQFQDTFSDGAREIREKLGRSVPISLPNLSRN